MTAQTGVMARTVSSLQLMRPKQWIKNLFIFAPILFTPETVTPRNVLVVALTFVAFSLIASSVYIINDIMDREADRLHPKKRKRPIASGVIPIPMALAMYAGLVIVGFYGAYRLPGHLVPVLTIYAAMNLLYSIRLKHVALIDVMVVALGFCMRVGAGSTVLHLTPSPWLVQCVGLIAVFLVVAKRRSEFQLQAASHRKVMEGYNKQFLDILMAMVLGSVLTLYLIYTSNAAVQARLGTDKLYYTAPFVFAGIARYLQLTLVNERSDSPTEIVTTDRFIILSLLGWFATLVGVVYLKW